MFHRYNVNVVKALNSPYYVVKGCPKNVTNVTGNITIRKLASIFPLLFKYAAFV